MEEVDKEISEMKLSLNARARVVAESYLTAVCTFQPNPPSSPHRGMLFVSSHHDLVVADHNISRRVVVKIRRTLLYRMSECKVGVIS